MRRSVLLGLGSLLLLVGCSSDGGDSSTATTRPAEGTDDSDDTAEAPTTTDLEPDTTLPEELRRVGRVDLDRSGNRVIEGPGDLLTGARREVDLGAEPVWIVSAAATGSDDLAWLVADVTGATHLVGHDGSVERLRLTIDPDLGPPLRIRGEAMSSPDPRLIDFDDPLPDSRVVADEFDRITAALIVPTDRYPHDVLGDPIEAGGFGIAGGLDAFTATKVTTLVEEPDVIEGVSPMLADVDDDGVVEVVVTVSNASDGARVVAYEIDGTFVAETDPIGRGNRWRNQLAVAPTGPNGEVELIDVRTPHIGGTLQFFQRDGARFEIVAAIDGYSTHVIGSRNLDLGIVSDADGDGGLDVVLPTQDLSELHVVRRTADEPGVEVVGELPLGGRLSTNVAAQRTGGDEDPEARVVYAAGTADGTIHLIG